MAGKQRNALPIGDQLQNYRVEDVLGSGGFGITYVAVEAVTERKVAIKEFLPSNIAVRDRDSRSVHPISESDREDYDWGLERFRQEAKVLITLEHRNIVPVLNYFEANGTGYLVMAYQDGKSLGALLKRDMTLSQAEIDEILLPIVDGVRAIHAAGFLHRDIKPDNIFVRSDGVPVIIDFGSARLALGAHTKSLTTIVSEGYAPFEQYQSDGHQGPWTDIYAIGATLYRCVTGRRPVEAPARVAAVVKGKPDPLEPATQAASGDYSPGLLDAIDKALLVDESARPQDIDAFSALLAGGGAHPAAQAPAGSTTVLVGGVAPQTSHDTLAPPAAPAPTASPASETVPAPPRPRNRHRLAWAAAIVAALVAGGASAYVAVERPWSSGTTGVETQALLEKQQRAAELKRKAEAEAARKQAEAEAKRKAEAEARQKAEAEAKRKAEAEAARQRAEAEARRKADAEQARKQAAAEAERKRAEAERKAQAEAARKRAEAEARRKAELEARRKAAAEARQRAEAEARRQAQAQAEAARKRAAAEARRKAEANTAQKRAQLEARRKQLAEARRQAQEKRRKALEEQRRKQLASRTPAAAQYLPGRRLNYRIETGRGQEFYEFAVTFKAGGALYMDCGYFNTRGQPRTCREYTGGPGRWTLSGNTLCLAYRYGRACFTLVRRGNGYALAPHNRDVRIRAFR